MRGARVLSAAAAALALATVVPWACGRPYPPPPRDGGAGGSVDAGADAGTDAGTDGGADGGADGGTLGTIQFPNLNGWKFYGPQHGAPAQVYGVTADDSGNIWVAGGEEGLFLLKPGSEKFQRFTLSDGLRPYGYLPDGGDPQGAPYLKVISVSGGPPNTVFVGYEGKPAPPGVLGCESNWDSEELPPDPSIYKSGDADRVTLHSNATLKVVHYDIFSGPGIVAAEPRGRERLCNILRIAYDKNTHSVWFGGNHGFARGSATYAGAPRCNGQLGCSGVLEHVHPAINSSDGDLLTDSYYGVSPALDGTGDVWFGGENRSTRFKYGQLGYWKAQEDSEANADNRLDIWPDAVPDYPTPSQRVDDVVSGMAAMPDGTVWVSSFAHGLAHLDSSGGVLGYVSDGLAGAPAISAIARDRWDDSIWTGAWWGGGISRIQGGAIHQLGYDELGADLFFEPVWDIQADRSSPSRRMLFAFLGYTRADGTRVPGAIGIYSGD